MYGQCRVYRVGSTVYGSTVCGGSSRLSLASFRSLFCISHYCNACCYMPTLVAATHLDGHGMPSNHSQFICFGAVYVAGYCIIHYTDKPFWERNMCVGVSALLAVLVSYSRCVVNSSYV